MPWPYTIIGEGFTAAYVADCGELCMEATEQFMANLPWCATCRR